jgi:DNA-binding NtrC family response regulator
VSECSQSKQIILIDRDQAFGQVLQKVLGPGYLLRHISTPALALAQLDPDQIDVVLLNLDVESASPADESSPLARFASERDSDVPVVAYGWDPRGKKALAAFQHGTFDFLEQPLDVQALKFALHASCRRATLLRRLRDAQKLLPALHVEGLLGNSKAMAGVNELVRKVSPVFTNVLITGESGTGKGVVARAIHDLGPRANKPFVAFSACAFPESLIEDELFGHEKGAFTGAIQSRRGRFEEAKGGTIFLDEIGDLAPSLQAKLLRVLQERHVERLGSNVLLPIDVRLICATSRNLEKMVQEGTFREDLYFRISVVRIHMPALRERAEDIPLLAEYFLKMFAKTHRLKVRGLTPSFLRPLASHRWPGNVRELQNVVERSLVLSDGSDYLSVKDLPSEFQELGPSEDTAAGPFHTSVRAFKRELVQSALRIHGGNRLKAARELGISRCYLHRLLNQLNIVEAAGSEEDAQAAEEALRPAATQSRNGSRELGVAARVA